MALAPLSLPSLVAMLCRALVMLLVVLLRILFAAVADERDEAAGATVRRRVVLCRVVLDVRRPVDVKRMAGALSGSLVAALQGRLVFLPGLAEVEVLDGEGGKALKHS